MNARCAVVFGQFGAAADPVNLPLFRQQLNEAGVETILIQHTDSQSAYNFLHGFAGKIGLVGASLGAMSVIVFAGYLMPQTVDFVGGFQPSDYDPSGHTVAIPDPPYDMITRAITVPRNCHQALCFRNPIAASTGALGHATWIKDADNMITELTVVSRFDVHPGDFPPASTQMLQAALGALKP